MSIGAVFDEAWSLYTRFFTRFFVIAAGMFLVVNLLTGFLALILADDGAGPVVFTIVNIAISLVGYFWVTGALVETARDAHDGKLDVSVGDVLRRVQPLLPTLIVAGLLAGIGIGIGIVLLVVPGLFLLTRWALIAPVIVLEGRSAREALSRSNELVKGSSWTVFALIVLIALLGLIVSAIVSTLFLALFADFVGAWLGNAIGNALVAPFFAIVSTVVYLRLTGVPEPDVL